MKAKYESMRAQSAIELLLILGGALTIFLIIIYISNQQLINLQVSKMEMEGRMVVKDLAGASKEVYYQGMGAKKRILIYMPEGVDPSKTFIKNNSIVLNVLGSDIINTMEINVSGNIPTTPGGHFVWVISKGGYVYIGVPKLEVEPSLLYFHTYSNTTSQFAQKNITVSNLNNLTHEVNLTLLWKESDVLFELADQGDASFELAPSESKDITFNITITPSALGVYVGRVSFVMNGENQWTDVEVEVSAQIC